MFQPKVGTVSVIASLIFLLAGTAVYADVEVTNPLNSRIKPNIEETPEAVKARIGPGNPEVGRVKSQLCQGCHGTFGDSTEPLIPKLAGQYANYIYKQVRNYQAGVRTHQIMNAMAGTLNTDDDIADVAAYFASQRKMKGSGTTENLVGKKIFLYGDLSNERLACINCHGLAGKGLEPRISMFPVIGGQHKAYIVKQLREFREGYRTNSPNNIMNRIASSLSDEQIEALAEYISVQ